MITSPTQVFNPKLHGTQSAVLAKQVELESAIRNSDLAIFEGKISLCVFERGIISSKDSSMKTMKFTYWQDGGYYLGFLNEYPDYQTQGMAKEELVNNLKALLADLESGEVPYIRKVEEVVVAE